MNKCEFYVVQYKTLSGWRAISDQFRVPSPGLEFMRADRARYTGALAAGEMRVAGFRDGKVVWAKRG